MNMRRPPRIGMVAPGISARLDREKPVVPSLVRDRSAGPQEVWIERSWMTVARVVIAPRRVSLPYLYECIWHASSVLVQNPASNDNPFALRRLSEMAGEIVVCWPDRIVPVNRSGQFAERVRQPDQRVRWRAPDRGFIRRVQ